MKTNISRRLFLAATLIVSTLGVMGSTMRPVLSHEADCPHCSLPVVQDTAQQDNEVKLRYGRKRIEYRCVYCALSETKSEYSNGDVTIAAPSEKKGQPVILKRTGGKWSATPASAVFIGAKVNHKYCQIGYRALTSRAAFNTYKAKHKNIVGDAKPLTLAQMIALAK